MTEQHEPGPEHLTRLRIDLAYDGTRFSGWAKQPGLRTVQGQLERAIAVVLRREPSAVSVTVAGRTDAGVHARGQVCHVDVTDRELDRLWGRTGDIDTVARRLNGVLRREETPDIEVHRVVVAPKHFDARFGALSRRYEYRVRPLGVRRDPLDRTFTVNLGYPVDLQALNDASATLLGLHDFTTFCKAREGSTAIRTLEEFSWREQPGGVLAARIRADAFCHSMVRSLVGAVLGVASGKFSIADLVNLRDARQRSSAIIVMPPEGLSLEEVVYPSDDTLAARAAQTRARRDPLSVDSRATGSDEVDHDPGL